MPVLTGTEGSDTLVAYDANDTVNGLGARRARRC